jgi:hypothetical protein
MIQSWCERDSESVTLGIILRDSVVDILRFPALAYAVPTLKRERPERILGVNPAPTSDAEPPLKHRFTAYRVVVLSKLDYGNKSLPETTGMISDARLLGRVAHFVGSSEYVPSTSLRPNCGDGNACQRICSE